MCALFSALSCVMLLLLYNSGGDGAESGGGGRPRKEETFNLDFLSIFLPFLSPLPPFLWHACCTELCIQHRRYVCRQRRNRKESWWGSWGRGIEKEGDGFLPTRRRGETFGARRES